MIYMIVPVLLATLVGMLRGGRLRNLVQLSIQHSWIPLVMITLQFSFVLFPQGDGEGFFKLRPWVNILTYALLIAFLAVNLRLPGLKLILIGAALNMAVILANGGFMPVTAEALAHSGHLDLVIAQHSQQFVLGSKDIVLPEAQTRLQLLSDVLGIPECFPVSATFSLGDVFIMVGAAGLTYAALTGVRSRHRKTVPGVPPFISPLHIIQAEPLDPREVDS
jgi:hypothetical protein